MPKKMLVADLLCGAGGSSTGASRALRDLGLDMELVCVNHWPTAIATHQMNHPEARHYVQDIATVRPHLLVPEGYLDLLMASPTCTHHSVARGGKPTSDQQRSDPWHIITWLTELRVKRIIIENVWEFIGWGPVDPRTGKPIKSRKGEYFNAWIEVMRRLNFDLEWRKINAANYGAHTTRSRFILKGRSDKISLGWAPITHAKVVDDLTLFPTLKPWRAAREIIDWNLKGKSIFARPRPLAPKTLARIYAGAVKFGWPAALLEKLLVEMGRSLRHMANWSFARRNVPKKKADRAKRRKQTRDAIDRLRVFLVSPVEFAQGGARVAEPLVITLRRHGGAKSTGEPIAALAANGNHVGVAEPVIVSTRQHTGGPAPRSAMEPVPTLTATDSRIAVAEPVVVNMKGRSTSSSVESPLPTQTAHAAHLFAAEPIVCGNRTNNVAKSMEEPVGGITTTTGGGHFLAEPLVLSQHTSGAAKTTDDPLPALTTGGAGAEEHPGCARPMLVEPFVLNRHGENGGVRAHSIENPLPTADNRGAGYVVEPFVATVAHGNSDGDITADARRVHIVDAPLGSLHGGGGKFAVVAAEAFVLSQGAGGVPRPTSEPVPTIPGGGAHSLIVPLTQSGGGAMARDVETDPIPTLTTAKGGEFGLVVPLTHAGGHNRVIDPADGPLPAITGAHRGELAFITAQHGERQGQSPRIHSLDHPAPAIAATGHVDLVEPLDYDVLFRMLEPHELAAAMGFNTNEFRYEFTGTKTEQIKQIGNAVSVEMMEAEVKAIMADAAPKASPRSLMTDRKVA